MNQLTNKKQRFVEIRRLLWPKHVCFSIQFLPMPVVTVLAVILVVQVVCCRCKKSGHKILYCNPPENSQINITIIIDVQVYSHHNYSVSMTVQ